MTAALCIFCQADASGDDDYSNSWSKLSVSQNTWISMQKTNIDDHPNHKLLSMTAL